MLFDYIFLLKELEPALLEKNDIPQQHFIIELSEEMYADKANLFEQLYSLEHQFCFFLSQEMLTGNKKLINNDLVKNLTTLLFLPNYLRHNGNFLLLLDKTVKTSTEFQASRDYLVAELKMQGISNIFFDVVDTTSESINSEKDNSACLYSPDLSAYLKSGERGVDFESLIKRLISNTSIGKKWVVPVDSMDDLRHTLKLIGHFESWFTSTQPLLTYLIMKCAEAEMKGAKLMSDNQVLRTKVKNGADYLKALKETSMWYVHEYAKATEALRNGNNLTVIQAPQPISHSESDIQLRYNEVISRAAYLENERVNILSWYKKEYDVLPKWYKQFGHIIKVMTGKRTFKSLFK